MQSLILLIVLAWQLSCITSTQAQTASSAHQQAVAALKAQHPQAQEVDLVQLRQQQAQKTTNCRTCSGISKSNQSHTTGQQALQNNRTVKELEAEQARLTQLVQPLLEAPEDHQALIQKYRTALLANKRALVTARQLEHQQMRTKQRQTEQGKH